MTKVKFEAKAKASKKIQGQGLKKIPRPRTEFTKTDPLEAKDRNGRGQSQKPRKQLF